MPEQKTKEIPQTVGQPPVVGALIIAKYQVGGQHMVDVKQSGDWNCGDFLDLAAKFNMAARGQNIGQVSQNQVQPPSVGQVTQQGVPPVMKRAVPAPSSCDKECTEECKDKK